MAEPIRRHAHELLSRQDTKNILGRLADENPKVIEDLVPKLLSLSVVRKVLQNLLRERVPILDAVTAHQNIPEDLEPTTKQRPTACLAGREPRSGGAA